ncbi:MAG: proline--tRNA ligase [Pseudobdellovibrionaceae bacterium]|nr:proline--tRNA ligase [Bdellovibrionales bacterium]USN46291.1 MAG: proline--tRNA ligase [Pseudobdellovibrionaceae bacterium]
MKWSQGYLFTLKETPADAEVPSHQLMVRGGYIRKLAQGIFTYGPLALRSIRKFEGIVREELDKRGCLELLMPMVQPREIWEETGRWKEMGAGLLKFKNRTGQDWCLGATHEEVITDYVRGDIKSYRDLPVNLYQIQTKFRDEIRPRFGLMRGREFIMKDAYSFDRTREEAELSYEKMYQAYSAIFSRLGVKFNVVAADSGNIGGNKSQEFHILADSGEDQLLVAEDGSFAANVEVCPVTAPQGELSRDNMLAIELFATPGVKTIGELSQFTGLPEGQLVKTMFFDVSDGDGSLKPAAVLLCGSDEVNPVKLKNLLGLSNPPLLLTDEEVHKVTGAWPGSCGPVGLSIPIYGDSGVAPLKNYVVGANEDGKHMKNVNHSRDFEFTKVADLRMARDGDIGPTGVPLKSYRGIEVGHIFYLGQKYSRAMQAQFLDSEGQLHPIEMGCYGIGISRTVQAVIEQCHDKDGIVWPLSIAPYSVHICLLDPDDESVKGVADNLYDQLNQMGVDCLMDDRNERPGVKFKDADLLGMPIRVTVGGRGVAAGEVEVVLRKTKDQTKVKITEATAYVVSLIEQQRKESIS